MRGLYAIIDPARCGGRDPQALAEAVLAGGCCALQLRDKHGSDDDYLRRARPMRDACRRAGVPFVVNDRAALVQPLGADGLHLGQDDLSIAAGRALAPDARIGRSTHDLAQVDAAVAAGADHLGFGPVFDTPTKDDPDPTVGPALLADAIARSPIPIVAIGGITADNLPMLLSAGTQCAAIISALASGPNPEQTARQFHQALLANAPT